MIYGFLGREDRSDALVKIERVHQNLIIHNNLLWVNVPDLIHFKLIQLKTFHFRT